MFIMICFSTVSNLKLRKILGKIITTFVEIDPQLYRFWVSIESSTDSAQNLEATLLFIDFSKLFGSIQRGKMEQVLLAYDLPEETVTPLIYFFKNVKAVLPSSEFFRHSTWRVKWNALEPYLFIICFDYLLRTSIEQILGLISSAYHNLHH